MSFVDEQEPLQKMMVHQQVSTEASYVQMNIQLTNIIKEGYLV